MKGQMFFNSFGLKKQRVIVLYAGDSKLGLVHSLAREAVNAGYKSLIISVNPMSYPVEGEVVIADSGEIILSTIEKKPPTSYYLAAKIENDLLKPLPEKQLKTIENHLPDDTKLFIHISTTNEKQSKIFSSFSQRVLVCEVNYNAIRLSFDSMAKKDKADANHPFEEKIHNQVINLISKNCPQFKSNKETPDKICYIGQIKNLYDENSILPIARQMKSSYNCRVFIGYIQNYTLKEV